MNEEFFILGETKYYIHYVIKGSGNITYNVKYNKIKNEYACTCPNIRLTACKHIKKIKEVVMNEN